MLKVFISSASGALGPYRQAAVEVCHRLGHQPVFMEDFDPQRPPPEDVCRAKVDGCDALVLLLAHRYGSRPPRLHPADRPHYDLAQALRNLGRYDEAKVHAHLAYRSAWADGPPYSRSQELHDASGLLQVMGEALPELPIVDPASVKIPLEDEVRVYIARLETQL